MFYIYTIRGKTRLFLGLLFFQIIMLFGITSVKAQQSAKTDTVVLEGFIETSTTLSAGKIYVVNHNVKVSKSATLNIEKNTTILFTHTSTLVVEGGLNVNGAPNAFVTFTSKDANYRGAGIVIRNNEGADINIKYAHFLKLSLPLNFEMNWYRNNVNIQHTLFRDINTGESAVVIAMPLGSYLGQTDKTCNFTFSNNNFINNWGSIFIENFQDNILNFTFANNVMVNNVVYGIDKGIPSNTPVFGLFDDTERKYLSKINENSVFGNYQINASTDTIIREISFGIQGKGEKFSIPNNYFRSSDPAYISSTFDHFYQNNELPLLISNPFLRTPSPNAHAHIYKVNIEKKEVFNYGMLPKTGTQNVEFEVFFNRAVQPVGVAQVTWVYFDTVNKKMGLDTVVIRNSAMAADRKLFTFTVPDASFMKNGLGYIVISHFKDEEGFEVPEFPIGQVHAINTYNKLYYKGLQSKYFNPAQLINNNLGSGKLLPEEMDIEKLESLSELGDLSYLGAYTSLARTWEVGLFGGTSNYLGDLSFKFMEKTQFRWSAGIFGQYNISKWFSTRLMFTYLRIEGEDIFDSDLGRRERYANFRSEIYEGALTFHFHVLQYGISKGEKFSPSVYAGIAVFHHNPMARIVLGLDSLSGNPVYWKDENTGKDIWIPLQPIGTEGQTSNSADPQFPDRAPAKQYSKWQIAVPMGINLDFIINKSWVIGADIGFRLTFTDYLDDVSRYYYDRGNKFQSIIDANPTIKGKAGRQNIDVPLTLIDYAGRTHNTAAVLAAPSVINSGGYERNDAFNFPDARRGEINRDWYIAIGVKVSKVFGYNKYEKRAKKAMEEEAKFGSSKKSSSSTATKKK
jgi:hypothetical protein